MRLEKIKLAGFKSFVDPTTILLPGNLVGVVGPNGCGKSNVIDAVRWVMGESSARHLRGESMADVIFNGSSTRKPVGQASVELVFDNSDGRAPGEYAAYEQIAIRRVVGRDGQSSYFLNGTRCRRKDITDLFLGTGLGARSYAIIEQGTISRLIEAKPDDLRTILEEAAGISRYKERRHETELRMRHTLENMERLRDLIEEVERQLASLQRQARKAEKFVELRDQERQLRLALMAHRWRTQQQLLDEYREALAQHDAAFREHTLNQQTAQTEETRLREAHLAQQDAMQSAQGYFYEQSAELGRLEQQIIQAGKDLEQIAQETLALETEQAQLEAERIEDQEQLETLMQEALLNQQTLAEERLLETDASAVCDAHAAQQVQWRTDWERLTQQLHQQQRDLELVQLRLQQSLEQDVQLDRGCERLRQMQIELQQDLGKLDLPSQAAAVNALREQRQLHIVAVSDWGERVTQETRLQQDQRAALQQQLGELHDLRGQCVSLETLQAHAFQETGAGTTDLLDDATLKSARRFAEHLQVEAGWETAAESLLAEYLSAVCVEDLDAYRVALEQLPDTADIALCQPAPLGAVQPHPGTLSEKVRYHGAPLHWLQHVHCADTLQAAWHKRGQLQAHEQIVLPDGLRIGPDSLLRLQPQDGKAGALKREQQLRELRPRLLALQEAVEELEQSLAHTAERLAEATLQREAQRQLLEACVADLGRAETDYALAEAEQARAQQRCSQIAAELAEQSETRQLLAEQRAEWQLNQATLTESLAGTRQTSVQQGAVRDAAEVQLQQDVAALEQIRQRLRRLEARQESLQSAINLIRQQQQRHQQRSVQLSERQQALRLRVEQQAGPADQALDAQRDEVAERRAEAELRLGQLRAQQQALETDLRVVSERRLQAETLLERVRETLQTIKLSWQASDVRLQGLQQQFEELGAQPLALPEDLPEIMDETVSQQQLQQLADDIARMGAVNLMAMEEHQEQSVRLEGLNVQQQDLQQALDALNNAIDRMDEECRGRFSRTFEQVNAGFQRMFPRLFGGGQARLDLQGDGQDPGVTVMARPPGKRNSSIHLLSGGEKALTAVALVFAIFELNPAPFCLLDEVDAPLDEANVGRFGELVRAMSEQVQFLFISHNKTTMEIARHLTGVTMQEPGVSRIVAVDLEAAVKLTQN